MKKRETDENGEWEVEEQQHSIVRTLVVPNETFIQKQEAAEKIKLSKSLAQILKEKGVISKAELDEIEPKVDSNG